MKHLIGMALCAVAMQLLSVVTMAQEHERETYYFRAGVGYPFVRYSDGMREYTEFLRSESGHRSLLAAMDIGLYWPILNHRALLGMAVTGFFDTYEGPGWNASLNFAQFGPSMQYTFTGIAGEGVYVRLDPGLVMQWNQVDISDGKERVRYEIADNSGFGILLGLGYAYPVWPSTRLSVELSYGHRVSSSHRAQSVEFLLGVLW
ncbi:MAG: hypothetical protein M5R41_03450 [Bacteroidia bacterium]|nr:hypothetical protein [Bacteroidia bacterium]